MAPLGAHRGDSAHDVRVATDQADIRAPARSRATLRDLAIVVAAVILALWLRTLAPSDLWDQTQPRTISYTADMVSRGGTAWILAIDVMGIPATKPPLYNWMAAPFVAAMGRADEFAHKAPSVLAFAGMALALVLIGNRLAPRAGLFAGLAFASSYGTFKLGYLARPDMVLCAILFVGWWATVRLLEPERVGARRAGAAHAAAFWLSLVLAAWVKGPVAVLLPAFAVLGAWVTQRSLRPLSAFRPLWGIPLALMLAPSWYVAAAVIDREHFVNVLWYDEIYGRLTGEGPEGGHRGLWGTIRGLPFMTLYFLSRFIPWSIPAALGAIVLLDRRQDGGVARWRLAAGGHTLILAVVWTVFVIAVFTLSSGKRADYAAPTFAPAALVAGWWLATDRHSPALRRRWVPGATALVVLALLTIVSLRGPVLRPETTRRFEDMAEALREVSTRGDLIVVAPQLQHLATLVSTVPPSQNSLETAVLLSNREGPTYLAVADLNALSRVYAMAENGHVRKLWHMHHTDEAVVAPRFYPSPLVLVEFVER